MFAIRTLRFALAAALAVICLQSVAIAQDGKERILREGRVTVGFATVKPWTFRDPSGTLRGIEPDLMNEILGPLGVKVIEPVGTDFNGLIPGLQAGRFDVSNGGLYITPQRCKIVSFSNPFLKVGDALIVRKGNPKQITSYKSFVDDPTLKFGTSRGTINSQNAALAGIPVSSQLLLPDPPAVLTALQSGRIDAAGFSRGAAAGFLLDPNITDLEVATPFTGYVDASGKEKIGHAAFAFRTEDVGLLRLFNEGLARLKTDGTLLVVLKRYGFSDADLPGDVTADQLCQAS